MQRSRLDENGWELCKDNIQPLSSERKMSLLAYSLDGSEHEQFARRQSELEEKIISYQGPDALEPWLHYISFLEQSCQSGGKISTKYDAILAKCCQTFHNNPEYKNDKRFIEIYIKGMQKFPLAKRVQILHGYLERGFGAKVSKIYISIAADFEALQDYTSASIILKKGIEAESQPIEDVREALNNLQHRVAERLAKNMILTSEESLRNVGSSVPICGVSNEAQNVRSALSPGFPCRAKPTVTKTDKSQFPVFQGLDKEKKELQNLPVVLQQPLPPMETIHSHQENYMKPRRWCDEVLPTPGVITTANQERIQISEEEPETQPSSNISRKINKGLLSERKIEEPSSDENSKPSQPAVIQKIMYRKDQLKIGSREITFEHLRSKEYLAKRGLNTVRALRLCSQSKKVESPTINQQQEQIVVNQETELKRENESLRVKLQEYEKTIENFGCVQKKNSEVIEQQSETIVQVQNALRDVNNSTIEMKAYFQLRIKELEATIDQEQDELYKTREDKRELQIALTNEKDKVQMLFREMEQMRQQFEEEKLRMEQCFDRERNESLLNFSVKLEQSLARQEQEQGLLKIDESSKYVQQKNNSTKPTGIPQFSTATSHNAQKLPFNLYESNMDIGDEISFVRPLSKMSLVHSQVGGSSEYSARPSVSQQSPQPDGIVQQKLSFSKYDNNIETIERDELARPLSTITSVNPSSTVQSEMSFPSSQPKSSHKLPFNLYESNMEVIENDENSFAKPLRNTVSNSVHVNTYGNENHPPANENDISLGYRNFMPPPLSRAPVRTFEEDKENLGGFRGEKRKMAKSGVLQPSTTTDPMELIYTEEVEGEDEMVIKRQEDTETDFNVTDLTRALEFFPKPLVNSTPEKVSHDITCSLPPPRRPLRGPRKSSLFKTFDIPSSYQDMQLHENQGQLKGAASSQTTAQSQNIQPVAYEEDVNFNDDEELSYNVKSYGQRFAQAENLLHNLSPIPETSKERLSGTSTSSSSSNNTTSSRGTVNYSTTSSYNMTKSISRPIGRFSGQ